MCTDVAQGVVAPIVGVYQTDLLAVQDDLPHAVHLEVVDLAHQMLRHQPIRASSSCSTSSRACRTGIRSSTWPKKPWTTIRSAVAAGSPRRCRSNRCAGSTGARGAPWVQRTSLFRISSMGMECALAVFESSRLRLAW